MSYETVLYKKSGRIATVTLNRPEKFNTIRPPMPEELEKAIAEANADDEVRVIILQGAGKSFCAGFDFSGNLEHFKGWGLQDSAAPWDPGRDMMTVTSPFTGSEIHEHLAKPQACDCSRARLVCGRRLGHGSPVRCHNRHRGRPDWDSLLQGLGMLFDWVMDIPAWFDQGEAAGAHRRFNQRQRSISGKEAEEMGLINKAYPAEELDEKVQYWAERMAQCPTAQLAAMKLVINQAYDNMGLHSTQLLGCILDGSMRNIPEGLEFVRVAMEKGVGEAVAQRDGPFGDYSQGPPELKPSKTP